MKQSKVLNDGLDDLQWAKDYLDWYESKYKIVRDTEQVREEFGETAEEGQGPVQL